MLAWDLQTVLYYGLGTYTAVVGSWGLACSFFKVIEAAPWAQPYRVQKSPNGGAVAANVDPEKRQLALQMVCINWAWLLPLSLLGGPVLKTIFEDTAAPPPLWQAPFVALLWFVLHDVSFYSYHRLMHEVPWMYKRFHKQHHMFTAPWAWSATAVHPVEMMCESVGGLFGPLLWAFTVGLPIYCFWLWLGLIQIQGVYDHCGFDLPLPWDIFGVLPGFGGTQHHDDHHQYYTCNYAAVFSFIDEFMGTCRHHQTKKS